MLHLRKKRQPDHVTGTGGTQILALSLFLMLLAFFIIMNAKSSYTEGKSLEIVQSVAESFSSSIRGKGLKPSITEGEDPIAIGEGSITEQIEGLFRSLIPAPDLDLSQDISNGTLQIQLPLDIFAEKLRQGGFGGTLRQLINSNPPYRMDMVAVVPSGPAALYKSDPEVFKAISDRLDSIARRLQRAGIAPAHLSLGMKTGGESGAITLVFRPRTVYAIAAPAPQNETTEAP